MRVLCIATKPPWPPVDGGRLALAMTLDGLAAAGHEVCVLSPRDEDGGAGISSGGGIVRALAGRSGAVESVTCPCRKRSWASAAVAAMREGTAASVARHHHSAMIELVGRCIREQRPDVVHVEQLQALPGSLPAFEARIPVVLRMQNVESDLCAQAARSRRSGVLASIEARRLARDEAAAIRRVARVIALTARDAAQLRVIGACAEDRVFTLPPPFPPELPAGPALPGAPAVVVAGSDWWPNAHGTRWFVREVLPRLREVAPRIHVHLIGGRRIDGEPALAWHAAPPDSIDAFPEGAIVAVPLSIASGIRMRILEAWARGCPVVATPVAVAGLEIVPGREALVEADPAAFAAAIVRLADDAALRLRLIAAGREHLRANHDPEALSARLVGIYNEASRAKELSAAMEA